MKNPTTTVAAKISAQLFEAIEHALYTSENKQRFIQTAIERELVRRKMCHTE